LAAIKEAFADDYRKARKPEEKLSLAEKLLSHAATDPVVAEKFVLLQEARDLGEAAGEPLLILQSIDAAGRDFKVDVVETVLERIDALTKMSSVPQTRIALVGALTHYADRAVAEEKFDAANKLLAAAVTIARKLKGRELLVKTTIGRQTDVAYQIDQLQKVKAAEATLAHGDDPAADLILGKYYCLNRGDWQTGLPYLAKSSDADLKKIAADELALAEAPEPKDANLQLQLADRWQALADAATSREKSKCGARAAFWYRAALPRLEGVAAVRVKKRLAEFDEGADRQ
jgi:hypothetical protein